MKKIKKLLSVFIAIAVVMSLFTIVAEADTSTVNIPITVTKNYTMATKLFNYINEQRTKDGLNLYVMDSGLSKMAMERAAAQHIADTHYDLSDKTDSVGVTKSGLSTVLEKYYPSIDSFNISLGEGVGIGGANEVVTYNELYGDSHKHLLIGNYTRIGIGAVEYHNQMTWAVLVSKGIVDEDMTPASGIEKQTYRFDVSPNYLSKSMRTEISLCYKGTSDEPFWFVNNGFNGNSGYYMESTVPGISFSSSDSSIFTVDSLGQITGTHAGSGTLTVHVGNSSFDVPVTVEKLCDGIGWNDAAERWEENSYLNTKISKTSYTYTGKAITPSVTVTTTVGDTLKEGTDYTVSYSNNVNVGTATITVKTTDSSNYDSENTITFNIVENPSDKGNSGSSTGGNTGTNTGGNTGSNAGSNTGGNKGSDTSSNAGKTDSSSTANNSSNNGSTSTTNNSSANKITKKQTISVKLKKSSVTYNGKSQKVGIKSVYVGSKKLSPNQYSVSYKNNKKTGIATITITGKESYKGYSAKTTFKIIPKKNSVSSLKAGRKKAVVKWKKVSQTTGYQVQYSYNKKFSNATIKTTGNKSSYTIKNLKSKKTVYVRVRSYKKSGKSRVYSSWSPIKKIRIK